jgi:hypothetical protein
VCVGYTLLTEPDTKVVMKLLTSEKCKTTASANIAVHLVAIC